MRAIFLLFAVLPLLAACEGSTPGLALSSAMTGREVADVSLDELAETGEGWTQALGPGLLGGIDACLGRASRRPALVVNASEYQPGFTFVTLREADLRVYTCVGRNDGQLATEYVPLPAGGRVPSGPIFTRRPGNPPSGRCMEVQRVQDAAGGLVGWISIDRCEGDG